MMSASKSFQVWLVIWYDFMHPQFVHRGYDQMVPGVCAQKLPGLALLYSEERVSCAVSTYRAS